MMTKSNSFSNEVLNELNINHVNNVRKCLVSKGFLKHDNRFIEAKVSNFPGLFNYSFGHNLPKSFYNYTITPRNSRFNIEYCGSFRHSVPIDESFETLILEYIKLVKLNEILVEKVDKRTSIFITGGKWDPHFKESETNLKLSLASNYVSINIGIEFFGDLNETSTVVSTLFSMIDERTTIHRKMLRLLEDCETLVPESYKSKFKSMHDKYLFARSDKIGMTYEALQQGLSADLKVIISEHLELFEELSNNYKELESRIEAVLNTFNSSFRER